MLDYLQLKETFGLDLETEVVAEVQDMKEVLSDKSDSQPSVPVQQDLSF